MKRIYLLGCLLAVSVGWTGCRNDETQLVEVPFEVDHAPDSMVTVEFSFQEKPLTAADIVLTKDLLYDKYTLKDTPLPCHLEIQASGPEPKRVLRLLAVHWAVCCRVRPEQLL